MSTENNALVDLAHEAVRIQKQHGIDIKDRDLFFDQTLQTVDDALYVGLADRESLAAAIADAIEKRLNKGKGRGDLLFDCLSWARRFVDEVWFGPVLDGHSPALSRKAMLRNVYRGAAAAAMERTSQ